ncbi:MAG: hypothetical protein JSU92_07825 [Deltaproteobacteria bacterium]|nr:MAG: hypothetical protein JSU92_07825 [Deltaproteobacteria bacterium]
MAISKGVSFQSTLVFAESQTTLVRIRRAIREAEQVASETDARKNDINEFRLAAYNKIKSIIKHYDDPPI